MSVRTDNAVTFSHQQAECIRALLADYSTAQAAIAHRTHSEAIRAHCQTTAREASDLAAYIVRALYTWI